MSQCEISQVDQALKSAAEELYGAFFMAPPEAIEGCPCCIETRGVDVLLNTPLRKLSGDDLWRYISGAFLTVGGDSDFRYLLPRIFELSAFAPHEVPNTEIVIGSLARSNWSRWQDQERDAVSAYIAAWFEYALEADLKSSREGWPTSHSESVLCGAVCAGLPTAEMLLKFTEPRYAPVLEELIERYPNRMSAFWEDAPGGMAQIALVLAKGTA